MLIDIELESTSEDNVHWKLTDTTKLDFTSFSLTTTNKYLDDIVTTFKSFITSALKELLPQVSELIDKEINVINSLVAQESAYTWDFNILSSNYPLNMSQTTAPIFLKDSGLMKFNFDGQFHKPPTANGFSIEY